MKPSFTKAYLLSAGFIMLIVGAFIALAPIDYLSSINSHVNEPHINMLSDLRGMGGMMLVLSVYIIISVIRRNWQRSALLISTLVYVSFVVLRSLGFFLDGLPDTTILVAFSIECVLAVFGILLIRAGTIDEKSSGVWQAG